MLLPMQASLVTSVVNGVWNSSLNLLRENFLEFLGDNAGITSAFSVRDLWVSGIFVGGMDLYRLSDMKRINNVNNDLPCLEGLPLDLEELSAESCPALRIRQRHG
jgi:hypothetical protein